MVKRSRLSRKHKIGLWSRLSSGGKTEKEKIQGRIKKLDQKIFHLKEKMKKIAEIQKRLPPSKRHEVYTPEEGEKVLRFYTTVEDVEKELIPLQKDRAFWLKSFKKMH